MQGRPLFQM